MLAALLVCTLDANSQTRRQSSPDSADGFIHLNVGRTKVGLGYSFVPFDATFKERKKTANGQVIVEYNYHIEWPDKFDLVFSNCLSKVKGAIINRVIKSGDEYVIEVIDGIDMTSHLQSWLEDRVSSLRYMTDENQLYCGPLKNDLSITLDIENGHIKVISKEIVTDLKNKSLTYESEETF